MTNLSNVVKTGGIQGAQISSFKSAQITGDGSAQSTAHGLGRVPDTVFVYLAQKDTTTAFDLVEGAHDATNIIVTVAATAKYRIIAY